VLKFIRNDSFHSVFAFGAPVVDPLLVMTTFLPTVMEFHIFSRQAVITATERALHNFGYHSPVYLCISADGKVYRFRPAPHKYAPNGNEDEVRCCGKFPLMKGFEKDKRGRKVAVKFRCIESQHPNEKPRKFRVEMLPNRGASHWFVDHRTQRFIAEVV
jgi:hypothetical protein